MDITADKSEYIDGDNAFFRRASKIEMLSEEDEKSLIADYQLTGNQSAANKVVLSHIRLSHSIARKFIGFGLPQSDLMQEGVIGIMKALKRYSPDHGVRFSTFSMKWIQSEMNEYVVKNWRLVKIATTKSHRKLFFNLKGMKAGMHLSEEELKHISETLNVKPEAVRYMDARFYGQEFSIDSTYESDEEEDGFTPYTQLQSKDGDPLDALIRKQESDRVQESFNAVISRLDHRTREIFERRWLSDEGETPTLSDLAKEYNVSIERVRQIEKRAMDTIKSYMISRNPAYVV
jgi:RNA polymerase sigma-32 factor